LDSQKLSILSQSSNVVSQTINDTNVVIGVIDSAFQYRKITPLFGAIISAKSKSISLHQMLYSFTGTSTSALVVSGMSTSRVSLVAFVKNLQTSEFFTSVDSPVSNLEKDKDIDFTISLSSTK
jgi:hypothetical protein